jgi:competence protein ComEC
MRQPSSKTKLDFEDLPEPRSAPILFPMAGVVLGFSLGLLSQAPSVLPAALGLFWAIVSWVLTKRPRLWAVTMVLAVLFFSWWYQTQRLSGTQVPSGLPVVAQERTCTLRMDKIFRSNRDHLNGLATLLEPAELAGTRVALRAWTNGHHLHEGSLLVGSHVLVKGSFEALPQAGADTTSFDHYLRASGVTHRLDNAEVLAEIREASALRQWASVVRSRIRDACHAGVRTPAEARAAGTLTAMLTGDKRSLRQELREVYTAVGTMHLFAVSGLHIAILTGAVAWVLRWAGLGAAGVALVVLPLACGFVWVVGAPPSAVRALTMLTLWWLASLLPRQAHAVNACALAALVLLVWQPLNLQSVGFLLSFGVVAGLLWVAAPYMRGPARRPSFWSGSWQLTQRWHRALSGALAASVTATLFSTPIAIQAFGLVSPIGILMNLVATLPATVIVLCGALSAAFGLLGLEPLAVASNWLAYQAIYLLEWAAGLAQSIPGSHFALTWREAWLGPLTLGLMVAAVAFAAWWRWQPWQRLLLAASVLAGMLVVGVQVEVWPAVA